MELGCCPALHYPFPGLPPQQGRGSDPQTLPKTAPNEAILALGYRLDHSSPDPVLGALEVALGYPVLACQGWEKKESRGRRDGH